MIFLRSAAICKKLEHISNAVVTIHSSKQLSNGLVESGTIYHLTCDQGFWIDQQIRLRTMKIECLSTGLYHPQNIQCKGKTQQV